MTDLSTTFQPNGWQMPFGWEYEPGWSHAAAWGKMRAGQIVMANKRLDNGGLAFVPLIQLDNLFWILKNNIYLIPIDNWKNV